MCLLLESRRIHICTQHSLCRTSEGKKGVDLHLGDVPMSHPFLLPDQLTALATVAPFHHTSVMHLMHALQTLVSQLTQMATDAASQSPTTTMTVFGALSLLARQARSCATVDTAYTLHSGPSSCRA